ncbi:glycosyltransferase family 2 protein [Bradyrhizobium sacchari]|uniref:Glycosyltransferase domain-containing protein n=1 Tax=Bradyrhizobium sacchari TaxID=1399419 RepID=A0A560JMP8_9BRAD|nr:TIGR00180 family glycosyltransferase [Bradyrhizobium sacchari]TWB59187.1 glycosyltransferase domain-containing protein [Bradyrhizobium sacchari]TWB72453.1 glycosyltransferase domain-containing protein [Bradyrhizobium sacchari]
MSNSLVTVGIPTYNRPEKLARALDLICCQSHGNLQILVSDNASEDPRVAEVVQDRMRSDPRVSYHRHETNLGPLANFRSLIDEVAGEFFLWAADDDRWEPFFIARCVNELERDPSLALCQMEGQYEVTDGLFEFFAEGEAFYDFSSASAYERVQHLIRNNFDKLFYGVYRAKFLKYGGRSVLDWIGPTFNEIPLLILLAAQGNIRVLPTVGMYKIAAKSVCEQARWEQIGGRYPVPAKWGDYFRSFRPLHKYHSGVISEVSATIDDVIPDRIQAQALRRLVAFRIRCHELYFVLRWKPRRRGAP